MVDWSELKRLAEAATPGPWAYEAHGDTGEYGVGFLLDEDDQPAEGRQESGEMLVVERVAPEVSGATNAAFIAAANPAAILALIAENEQLRDDLVQAHQATNSECMDWAREYEQRKEIQAERDQLRAEVEVLRKDAERYRWLRNRDLDTIHLGGIFAGMTPENVVVNGENLDQAIDASMNKEVAHG